VGNRWFRRSFDGGPAARHGGQESAGARLGTVLELPAGRVLCHEGDLASQQYFVLSGAVAVTSGGRPGGTVTAGQWVTPSSPDGTTALLAATATTICDVRVLVFEREEYGALGWVRPHGEVRIAAPRAADAVG
jgi:hypothetical protein